MSEHDLRIQAMKFAIDFNSNKDRGAYSGTNISQSNSTNSIRVIVVDAEEIFKFLTKTSK